MEGKLEPLGPSDPLPLMVTRTCIVDKEGSLIRRQLGDFRQLNQNTKEYYSYPTLDAEAIFEPSYGATFPQNARLCLMFRAWRVIASFGESVT